MEARSVVALGEDAGQIRHQGKANHDQIGPKRVPEEEDRSTADGKPVAKFAAPGFADKAAHVVGVCGGQRAFGKSAASTVPVVVERTNVLYVTNAASGAVAGYAVREPVATNMVTAIVTNVIPVFMTNVVQVPVTNLVAKPEAEAVIAAAGSVTNTFLPGIGSILALALGGLYHGYQQVRNRKVNEALIQGVETARAVLTTTPQGQAADAQFVKWLMDHQKEAGVFATVSGLVEQLSDNPAAKMTAQEIAARVQQATQQRGAGQAAAAAG